MKKFNREQLYNHLKESVFNKVKNTKGIDIEKKIDDSLSILCNYNGDDIFLHRDDEDVFEIQIKNYTLSIPKQCKFDGDARYFGLNGVTYSDCNGDLIDGHFVLRNGDFNITDEKWNIIENSPHLQDKVECDFPTLREVFSNPELIDIAFSYEYDSEGFDNFLELVRSENYKPKYYLEFIFEGFFFNDFEKLTWCVNGKKVC